MGKLSGRAREKAQERMGLDRIVTRTGDGGTTGLASGARVSKAHARVEAIGSVDELNSLLGVLRLYLPGKAEKLIRAVQSDLFALGADLAAPGAAPRLTRAEVSRLENAIESHGRKLPVRRGFVLPGGTAPAAWLHFGRAVCRRTERRVAALAEKDNVGAEALKYLNRLSDLLYVLAREANARGRRDILWKPGPRLTA